MPFHWNPSRRRFAGTLAATAASSMLPSSASSAVDANETWALLSDTHIAGNPDEVVRGVNMRAHLEKVVMALLSESEGLAGVIIDGDCALDAGFREDYKVLARTLAPLAEARIPVHLTLGNHDDRGPFSEVFSDPPAAVDAVDNKHLSLIETPRLNWILLDSLRIVDEVAGEFGADQIAWLDGILSKHSGKPAVLVGHHYPQAVREMSIAGDAVSVGGLEDSEAFLAVARRHPHVQGYIYGHSHDWEVTTDESGLHHVNLPPTAYVFDESRPSGWVRATVSREHGLTLELVSLDPGHEQHGERFELAWR